MEKRPPPTSNSTRFPRTLRNDDKSVAGDEEIEEEEAEAEVEKLEVDVKELAHKLSTYRSTLPDQIRSGFADLLASQRPQFPHLDLNTSEPATGQDAGGDAESSEGVIGAGAEDEESAERIRVLKEKISSNISAIPLVLKRMNECIYRIDKLNTRTEIIHPAFKRKRS